MRVPADVFLVLAAVTACGGRVTGSAKDGGDDGSGSPYPCINYSGSGCSTVSGSGDSGVAYDGNVANHSPLGPPPPDTVCGNGPRTSVSGKVYDPASKNPLYNVTVYLTSSTPLPFPRGASCQGCTNLYTRPILGSAVTDPTGYFRIVGEQTMGNVITPPLPTGDLNLIVQVGKWRKVYPVNIKGCQDNPQADHTLRLPRDSSEGSLPDVAISTGGADSLECLPLRMGVSASEYVSGNATGGHVHIFTGHNGATTRGGSPSSPLFLWDKLGDMTANDVVVLSCEGAETANLDDNGRTVLSDYAKYGGRVFASHYHYSFFTPSGPVSAQTPPVANWTTGSQADHDPITGRIATTLSNGMPFPEGNDLKSWLGNVGALTGGELPIHYACDNAQVSAANSKSTLWISADKNSNYPGYAQYFSFEAAGVDAVCGRIVYSDLHVSGGPNNSADPNTDYPGFTTGGIVPSGCSSHDLTPQEKALEFMLLDQSGCLVPIGSNAGPPMAQ